MKNTTKLKHILQLYTISLDMDDETFYLTTINKRTGSAETFIDKKYTTVMEKAFSLLKKELKKTTPSK